jgi:hypothetical protein
MEHKDLAAYCGIISGLAYVLLSQPCSGFRRPHRTGPEATPELALPSPGRAPGSRLSDTRSICRRYGFRGDEHGDHPLDATWPAKGAVFPLARCQSLPFIADDLVCDG